MRYDEVEIENKFDSSKKQIDINKVNIRKILISDEFVEGKNKERDA